MRLLSSNYFPNISPDHWDHLYRPYQDFSPIQLLKRIFYMKTVTQLQNSMKLLYVILSIRLWILLGIFGTRDVRSERIFFSESFFYVKHGMLHVKKSFRGWHVLRSDISRTKKYSKSLQFPLEIQASRIPCC